MKSCFIWCPAVVPFSHRLPLFPGRSLSEPLMTFGLHRDLMCAASKTPKADVCLPAHLLAFQNTLNRLQTAFGTPCGEHQGVSSSLHIQTVAPLFACLWLMMLAPSSGQFPNHYGGNHQWSVDWSGARSVFRAVMLLNVTFLLKPGMRRS